MQTILTWYQSGGPFMLPLLVVGVAGLLLLGERVGHIVLKSRINARPFIERVISLVRAGKLEEALKLCAEHQSAVPDLGLVILRSRTNEEEDLVNVAEAATLTVIPGFRRRLEWLPVLAHVAVLLGALGAIANLHEALMRSAQGVGGANARVALLTGIAYALRPLGAGILTAIPLVAGHAYLRNESQRIIGQLEEFSTRLVNALIDRPDVRLGHRT
jgi:biopolymer transport protein ExbB/TolQ